MAMLGFGEEPTEWACGGSLISTNAVLTAAHCNKIFILSKNKYEIKEALYVALGRLKRSDPEHLWLKVKILNIIQHPDYKSPSKYHDIALVITDKYDPRGIVVQPACFDRGQDESHEADALGFGKHGRWHTELANNMQQVTLQRLHPDECKEVYPPHRNYIKGYDERTQMCYGHYTEIRDTCEGDSGGPLQIQKKEGSQCQYIIIGVTSYGRHCDRDQSSTVRSCSIFTRINFYRAWIEDRLIQYSYDVLHDAYFDNDYTRSTYRGTNFYNRLR